METLLSYFYSTIPQVLSGTIALFGVFSLYKLNLIKSDLKGLAESMAFEIEVGNYPDNVKNFNKDDIRRLRIGALQGNPYKMKSSLYSLFNSSCSIAVISVILALGLAIGNSKR